MFHFTTLKLGIQSTDENYTMAVAQSIMPNSIFVVSSRHSPLFLKCSVKMLQLISYPIGDLDMNPLTVNRPIHRTLTQLEALQ